MGSSFTSTTTPAAGDSPVDTVARGKWNYLYELLDWFGTHTVGDAALFNWGAKGSLYVANAASGLTVVSPLAAGKFLRDNGVGNDPTYEWGSLVQTGSTFYDTAGSTTAAIPYDDTIPQNTEGTEIFTLVFTPKYSDSILEIDVLVYGSNSSSAEWALALFKDSTADALASAEVASPTVNVPGHGRLLHRMTSGATSAMTFKVRVGTVNGGTLYYNNPSGAGRKFGGTMRSYIRIVEYKA